MKKYPNLSQYFYVDISILLCLIFLINSVFISAEVLKEIDGIGNVSITIDNDSNSNFNEFLFDVAWYLFFYIVLEIMSKALSLLELIAKIIGKSIKVNIKLLNKYCSLLLLILGGKFLIFIIASLF